MHGGSQHENYSTEAKADYGTGIDLDDGGEYERVF